MKKSAAKHLAIIRLHEQGFGEDFQLIGNDLFWSQGKEIISSRQFVIVEEHISMDVTPVRAVLIVFGIVVNHLGIKGILINRCKNYPSGLPPDMREKLADLYLNASGNKFSKKTLIDSSNKHSSNEN